MDPLYEILAPYFEPDASTSTRPIPNNASATNYLSRLSTLSLSDLTTTEPASLLHAAQSHVRNLQALSKRSHKAVISSAGHLEKLRDLIPAFGTGADGLQHDLPALETAASKFAQKYDRSNDNEVLDRRKRAMLLAKNVDRVSDVLELPTLLSSAVAAAQNASMTAGASSSTTSYASALDLHAHIKRLHTLYPRSELISNVAKQGDTEIQNLTSILMGTLQSPSLKLASAMRTIGWLRRVAPELTESNGHPAFAPLSTKSFVVSTKQQGDDGALGTLFLLCRLRTLHVTLEALEPLRELAEQEPSTSSGSQSERYLKRYVEIFREQSFNIVSMYKSIFPGGLPMAEASDGTAVGNYDMASQPSPLASFTLHLAEMLIAALHQYMPSITDRSARESLLTQVLYCAGSLGRLGADFGMLLAMLEEELALASESTAIDGEPEWAAVMKKHRIQAGRLEVLARGVGTGVRKSSLDVHSPSSPVSAGG
ncbi:hypothetical protein B0A48_08477 [Cryoendolithus antarcticus]|uniref:Conserved oligomeric Golgi complex subunit 8 n=1 Tax=Cryoendolithus antarcticus TaxID=1507870 RepID=A0A1V8T5S3_9PEZI|nr:hypothetical protein B0A48_08477 [Cryoendolithus antarcticus]